MYRKSALTVRDRKNTRSFSNVTREVLDTEIVSVIE